MTLKHSLMALSLLTPAALADEYNVTAELFEQKVSINGIAIPQQVAAISAPLKVYNDLPVLEAVAHGSRVKKGQQLVKIDTKKIDDFILETEKARASEKLTLQAAELELAALKLETERKLLKAQRTFERAQQNHQYYLEVSYPEAIKAQKLKAKRSVWSLENAEEELKQLLKMYEADGLTEETEEIILARAKRSVQIAQFQNTQTQLEVKRAIEVDYPRDMADKKLAMAEAQSTWEKAQKHIPRALALKEIAVEKARRADRKKQEYLDDLKSDRALAEMKSPIDGVVYYGEFRDGKWQPAMGQKTLEAGAKIPAHKVVMTVVAVQSPMLVEASVPSSTAVLLQDGQSGYARASAQPWRSFSAEIIGLDETPNLSGQRDLTFKADFPENLSIQAGETVTLNLVAYRAEAALLVPVSAVTTEADGTYSVALKMADGKTQKAAVEVGRASQGKVEILKGLEEGQVIIYDKK